LKFGYLKTDPNYTALIGMKLDWIFFFWQKEKIYKIKQRGTRLDWIFLIRHPKLNPTVSIFIFGADEFLSQNRFKPTMNTLTFIKREFRLPPYSFSLAPYEFSKILMYTT
jgi:hypothetical protein